MPKSVPVTVVETPEFLAVARRIMDDEERASLIGYLAQNPLAGNMVPGTGGVRKVRWALQGRGKSGGARVIYFFHNETMPLSALTVYAKKDRTNLSQAEPNDLRRLTALLVTSYARRTKR
ncbi:MAG: type II toxin-antitoxin system RelE/ParE family toxin [Acidobacteriota bacterium]